jgi:hypothetical protein
MSEYAVFDWHSQLLNIAGPLLSSQWGDSITNQVDKVRMNTRYFAMPVTKFLLQTLIAPRECPKEKIDLELRSCR